MRQASGSDGVPGRWLKVPDVLDESAAYKGTAELIENIREIDKCVNWPMRTDTQGIKGIRPHEVTFNIYLNLCWNSCHIVDRKDVRTQTAVHIAARR